MTTENEPPARYTSYHSDKTFSILEKVRKYNIPQESGIEFEYNGLACHLEYPSRRPFKPGIWELTAHPMVKYLNPLGDYEGEIEVFVQFDRVKFEEFIETFEIDGKTIKWILEHQKSWKYKFSAKHLEETLTGFSFWFIYRGLPCGISGGYISMRSPVRFDVTQYAPLVPGVEHWYDAAGPDVFSWSPGLSQNVETIQSGPFQTVGELLDTVRLNYKTLREIFDTEYDDGAVCCGMFDG